MKTRILFLSVVLVCFHCFGQRAQVVTGLTQAAGSAVNASTYMNTVLTNETAAATRTALGIVDLVGTNGISLTSSNLVSFDTNVATITSSNIVLHGKITGDGSGLTGVGGGLSVSGSTWNGCYPVYFNGAWYSSDRLSMWDDDLLYVNIPTSTAVVPMFHSLATGGTAVQLSVASRPGVWRFGATATANSYSGFRGGAQHYTHSWDDAASLTISVRPVAPAWTNWLVMGIMAQSTTAFPTAGAFWLGCPTTNANWVCITATNGVHTVSDSGVSLASTSNVFGVYGVDIVASNKVVFSFNGVPKVTNTTGLAYGVDLKPQATLFNPAAVGNTNAFDIDRVRFGVLRGGVNTITNGW